MARKQTRRLSPGTLGNVEHIDPVVQRKAEFARRLYEAMIAKGWKQSDLARAAFGTTKDSDGRVVAKGRDSISTYMRGKTVPTAQRLQELADALGVEPGQLDPFHDSDGIEAEIPEFEIRSAAQHPGRAWLRVNKVVSFTTATKVAELIRDDA